MSDTDIKNKNLVLIDFLRSIITDYKVKAEYSTNDNDDKVIVVQEQSGNKVILYETNPIYNYYEIDIFGTSIKDAKDVSVEIDSYIGKNIYLNWNKNEKWQIMVKQFSNPRTIEYTDIRRVAYALTLQCIVNRIA